MARAAARTGSLARHDKRLATRLCYAKLRQQACVEDIDYRTPRGLDRALFAKLVEGRSIDDHTYLLICGPAGVGKSWLASALGHKACRDNRSLLDQRVPRLFDDLAVAPGDGRHSRLLRSLGRVDLLILNDWGLEPLDAGARHDLLEILEDRYGHRSTIVTSQLPVEGETLTEYWDYPAKLFDWHGGGTPNMILDDGGDDGGDATNLVHASVRAENGDSAFPRRARLRGRGDLLCDRQASPQGEAERLLRRDC